MLGLKHGRKRGPLRLKGRVAGGAPEQLQKRKFDAPIGQFNRPLVIRKEGEGLRNAAGVFFTRPRDLIDRIEKDFRIQPAGAVMGKPLLIGGVPGVWQGRGLIGWSSGSGGRGA